MGILTYDTIEQINLAITERRTFSVVILPTSSTILWFEANKCKIISRNGEVVFSDSISFDISPWLQPFAKRWKLTNATPAFEKMQPYKQSMTRHDYIKAVSDIIEICKQRNGKTVFSRTICGEIPNEDNRYNWGETADKFFTPFVNTLRYILYSPQTGGWMGATPELLIEFNKITGQFHTVAFAGTRKKSSTNASEWDKKNIRENRFVSTYIVNALQKIGIQTTVSPSRNVTYGNIEHLCADISGTAAPHHLSAIIDAINPTPALCGFPKEDALADLAIYEPHKRYLYGGFIAIDTVDRYMAFVNLRCIHFDQDTYCIYGGGGIVGDSVPEREYDETVAKTNSLVELLSLQKITLS